MIAKRNILLIDDDKGLCILLRDFLQIQGYAVTVAHDGEAGLSKLDAGRFDLIILDVNMPGMGGVEFLKNARAQGGDLPPVFVLTARGETATFFEGIDVAGFMAKPGDPDALVASIRAIIGDGEEEQARPGRGRRVVIVEDDPRVAAVLTDAFRREGYDVEMLDSGPDAVERVVGRPPDLVLIKHILGGLNGEKIAAMLGQLPTARGVPVCLYDDTGTLGDEPGRTHAANLARRVKSNDSAALLQAASEILSGP
jgi:DNA-binding response OmpR family regulator